MVEQSGSIQGVVDCHGSHGMALWYEVRYGTLPEWFHWGISRKSSEDLLMPKPVGHFLIRVSESQIGYTLSYRGLDRCKHFMIELTADARYMISGANQRHRTLQDLVDFHRLIPISMHEELLTVACRQSSAQLRTDPAVVLFSEREPSLRALAPQNNLPSPAPPEVTPVPMMRKRYFQPPAVSTVPPTSNHSASLSASRFSSDLDTQMDPVPNNVRQSEGGSADIEYLEFLFECLNTECMNSTLPQEYSTPPPFSPEYKEQ